MLKQRVVTALVMAGLFLAGILFLPLLALAVLFAVLVLAGGWEWSRLAGWEAKPARALYVLVLAAAMVGLYFHCQLDAEPTRERVQPVLGLACLWWSFALLWVRSYPASAVIWSHPMMRSLMGLLVLAPAWMAAVYLLSYPRGGALMVTLVLLVAAADIGAYFAGKSLGKHKMAPAVSPAKTWEGFWGGALAVAAVGLLLWYTLPARGAHISLLAVLAVALTTSMASVVGDLTVSMVKRESGAKDSGSLLPGHGGILDRLDSLSGAAPVFALGLLLAGW
ncbi:phosphatidate cytidylyltransferase [Pseudohalioglobus sediminis]|uniref:Phosphatidate cytidylyltransferase n=1 Tax=Pseudohalioglobus sediminis TaxID=2606449 RepID=A0A5B0X584_9GAMM|nr:phosphatidate cytidylyltransferase [Pseudohalioglobus sediminis]KAA1194510.1 phosphatidate cytidylyltransferase [Pseudohalioglobus sediminis]